MSNLLSMPGGRDDSTERELALDVTRSCIVEAPAGSGKTGLLIQRYLALLASDSVVQPEQVLAITFTRAATEEIRSRILRELRAAITNATVHDDAASRTRFLALAALERDHKLSWGLLDDPRRLRIRTIDGLSSEIAHSLPVLTTGAARLKPIEAADPLYREAARRTLLRLGQVDTPSASQLDHALRTVLLHRDGDLAACEALIAEMLSSRDQWSELIPLELDTNTDEVLHREIRAKLDQALEHVLRDGLSRLAHLIPAAAVDTLTRIAIELAHAEPASHTEPHPFSLCRDLVGSPDTHAAYLEQWKALLRLLVTKKGTWRNRIARRELGASVTPSQAAELMSLIDSLQAQPRLLEEIKHCLDLPPARYPDDQWIVARALFRILRHAIVELATVFSEQEVCDFAEPALLARVALDRSRAAMELRPEASPMALPAPLRHLLVDEVQDTSSRQYELLERLTAGWDGSTRTVFLVGDPKQSIYLFRQARVERFLEIMEAKRLGSVPLGLLRLTANFRSRANLVVAANTIFSGIFTTDPTGDDEIHYTAAVSTRGSDPSRHSDALLWNITAVAETGRVKGRIFGEQARRDAKQIRSTLEAWLDRPLPSGRTEPWRLAVLVQNRASLQPILRELRSGTPLPFRAIRIEPLSERREVLDLVALTRALLHPADRIAWLAVLRAPWCGLGLRDLHHLAGADESALADRDLLGMMAERGAELSTSGIHRLDRVTPILRRASQLVGELRTPELVERTWRSLGGNCYLVGPEYENAQAFLALLRTIDRESGEVVLSDLLRRLAGLYAAPAAGPTSIDLMTIHGAKGLEWDVVIVPELERAAPHHRHRLLEWEELSGGRGVILAPIPGKGQESQALHKWLRLTHASRQAAERKRLFYVACTRAREELQLFGTAIAGDKKIAPNDNSLLQAAWDAAQGHVHQAAPLLPSAAHEGLSLAAAASDASAEPERDATPPPTPPAENHRPMIERVPANFRPFAASSSAPSPTSPSRTQAALDYRRQADSSIASRALGNVVHAMLEFAARQCASGHTAEQLRAEAEHWQPRYRALLRDAGVPPRSLDGLVQRVRQAIDSTFTSPVGLWILQARPRARIELPVTTWREQPQAYRIDRTFLAGDLPGSEGDSQLWIVDYKTSAHGRGGLTEFLDREQARYREQLERYADALAQPNVRLAIWFPFAAELRWWAYRPAERAMPHEEGHASTWNLR